MRDGESRLSCARQRTTQKQHDRFANLPALTTGLIVLLAAFPALAIPSPDLVINAFANIAQLFGLMTVTAGGIAVFCCPSISRGDGVVNRTTRPLLKYGFWVLLLLFIASAGANVLQWTQTADTRNERLQRNLVRPSIENGGKVGDVSLRTLNYSAQVTHPQGITTEELAQLMTRAPGGGKINFIDIRESEEIEPGRMAGFDTLRFPDLLAQVSKFARKGSRNILLCHSGNRSSEACEALTKKGIPCEFVVGGFEKWHAESRPVEYGPSGPPQALRAIPAYPNMDTLLDTPEVEKLVAEEDAQFIDVRYPGEFTKGHLPGAVNITVRRLTTEKLANRLNKLSKRPIIAPCYDKRSCFYAKILGLKLHRQGLDFRGRYTVPAEFIAPSVSAGQKPYVAAWMATNQNPMLRFITEPLAGLLQVMSDYTGHLAIAILLFALLFRVTVAPLSIKSERDRIVQVRLAREVSDLRERLGDQPRRLSRALRSLYRRNRLTPVLNLLCIVIQIPLFLVMFPVIDEVIAQSSASFLWLSDISAPDPLYLLPLVVGALTAGLLRMGSSNPKSSIARHAMVIVPGVLITALCIYLNAGLNLYLVTSLGIMVAQNALVGWFIGRRKENRATKAPRPLAVARLVPLAEAHKIAGVGTKATRLGMLIEAGFPVPAGFVIPSTRLNRHGDRIELTREDLAHVEQLWQRMGPSDVAVRSSGLKEDGDEQSYAGIFTSILDVTRDGLDAALIEVHDSMTADQSTAYGTAAGAGGGIIVQTMVDAQYAGVLFTEHPAECGSVLVELCAGKGTGIVDGSVAAQSYQFGRFSGHLIKGDAPPIDLAPLLELGRRIERLFGGPQDVEWAYLNGRFHILQARNVTALVREQAKGEPEKRLFERERHRLIRAARNAAPDEIILEQSDLTELLPEPTPMSLSVMQRLWAPGGSRNLSCDALGIPYMIEEDSAPLVTTAFGRLYIDKRLDATSRLRGPGVIASFRLSRSAEVLEQEFRENFLPMFQHQMRQSEALDLGHFDNDALLDLFGKSCDRFIRDVYVQADVINLAASFYLGLAERELNRRGLPTSSYLSQVPETIVHRALSLLPDIHAGRCTKENFLELFGHRATTDYELAEPRYGEDTSLVDGLAAVSIPLYERNRASEQPVTLPSSGTLAVSIHRARKFQALKEEAKHHCLREFAFLRRLLVEIDTRFELDGGVFYLRAEEIPDLDVIGLRRDLLARIARRRARAEYFKSLPALPTTIRLSDLETYSPQGCTVEKQDGSALRRTLVAGSPVSGPARIADKPEDVIALEEGEILVVRFLSPEWTRNLPKVGGIVSELGGWLSHAAILARELNVPTVVGVKGATGAISTGDLLHLHQDGRVEIVSPSLVALPASDGRKPRIAVS